MLAHRLTPLHALGAPFARDLGRPLGDADADRDGEKREKLGAVVDRVRVVVGLGRIGWQAYLRGRRALGAFNALFISFLMAPVAVVVLVAFTPAGWLKIPTTSFSLRWFRDQFGGPVAAGCDPYDQLTSEAASVPVAKRPE